MSALTDEIRRDLNSLRKIKIHLGQANGPLKTDDVMPAICKRIEKACSSLDSYDYCKSDAITVTLTITDKSRKDVIEVASVRAMAGDTFRALLERDAQIQSLGGAVNAVANEAIEEWVRKINADISGGQNIGG